MTSSSPYSSTRARAHHPRKSTKDLNWVLSQVINGDVTRTDTYEYVAHGINHPCTDTVYELEAAGYVTLRRDGSVSPTHTGRAHHNEERNAVDPNAYQTAERVCLALLNEPATTLPVQVHTGTPAKPTVHNSAVLPRRQPEWMVRLVAHQSHVCVLTLGRGEGASHEHLNPPIWVGYPDGWDPESEAVFTRRLGAHVEAAARVVEAARLKHAGTTLAGRLPGQQAAAGRHAVAGVR